MSISAVEKLRYEEMVMDILNKIFITGKRGLLWAVEALEYMVLRNKKVPKGDHIPRPIYQKAKEIRELIKDKDLYAREEDQSEFVDIVKQTVGQKIKDLLWMSKSQVKHTIKDDKKRLRLQKLPKQNVSYLRQHETSVDTAEEVELKDQWRINLMYPMLDDDEDQVQGLTIDELARLSNLIDNDRYHWVDAQLLTANLPLAHWLSSQDISSLILNGILDIHNPDHLPLLTEPLASEMKRLKLLSPVLSHGLITIREALDLNLEQEDEIALNDNALRERIKTLPLSTVDIQMLSNIGILENQGGDLSQRISRLNLS
jgi:hypothetical protein